MANNVNIAINAKNNTNAEFAAVRKNADDLGLHFRQTGVSVGNLFGQTFVGAATRQLIGSGMLGNVLIGQAAALAPVLGGLLAAAVLGSAGAGGIVGGVYLAVHDPEVTQAGSDLADAVTDRMIQRAGVFKEPLLQAVHDTELGFLGLEANVQRIFNQSAQWIHPLQDALMFMTQELTTGLADAVDGSGPVMNELLNGFRLVAHTASNIFSELADEGPEAAVALKLSFAAVVTVLEAIGETVEFLTNAFGALAMIGVFGRDAQQAMFTYKMNAELATGATQDLKGAWEEGDFAARSQADAIKEINEALRDGVDANIDAAEAMIDYRDALETAKEATDSKKGVNDDELTALLNIAKAANDAMVGMEEGGAATEDVAEQHRNARSAFIETAMRLGANREEAEKMAAAYLKVPANIQTQAKLSGVEQAIARARDLRNYLANIPDEHINVAVRLTGASPSAAAAALAKQYAATGGVIGGLGIQGHDYGGAAGGMAVVGEAGPELVKLPFGSTVYPTGQSKTMAQQMGGGGGVTRVIFAPEGITDELGRAILKWIQDSVRTEGGGDVNYLAGN
jgi:hypothetical protein